MARPLLNNERQLDVPVTVTTGTAKDVSRFTLNAVQISGSFAGGWDVDLEGTIDNVNWVTVANYTAAPATPVDLTAGPKYYSVRVKTNVAGTVGAASTPQFWLSGSDDGAWE